LLGREMLYISRPPNLENRLITYFLHDVAVVTFGMVMIIHTI